jgi:hypothetical protein
MQRKLNQAGIKFKKEIENQISTFTKSHVGGCTPPIVKLKEMPIF